jgi:hypothetical protein
VLAELHPVADRAMTAAAAASFAPVTVNFLRGKRMSMAGFMVCAPYFGRLNHSFVV